MALSAGGHFKVGILFVWSLLVLWCWCWCMLVVVAVVIVVVVVVAVVVMSRKEEKGKETKRKEKKTGTGKLVRKTNEFAGKYDVICAAGAWVCNLSQERREYTRVWFWVLDFLVFCKLFFFRWDWAVFF